MEPNGSTPKTSARLQGAKVPPWTRAGVQGTEAKHSAPEAGSWWGVNVTSAASPSVFTAEPTGGPSAKTLREVSAQHYLKGTSEYTDPVVEGMHYQTQIF